MVTGDLVFKQNQILSGRNDAVKRPSTAGDVTQWESSCLACVKPGFALNLSPST